MPPAPARKRHTLLAACLLAVAVSVGGFSACGGGDDDSVAEELARQREIAAARREAAQNARQAERVRQLSRKVNRLERESDSPVATADSGDRPEPGGTPASDEGRDLGDWPGGSAYSAMLGAFSIEENAWARQREATELGLDAGVLFSSEFSSLTPGYWVVFSGAFDSESQAAARAAQARSLGYSDSYPRYVSP